MQFDERAVIIDLYIDRAYLKQASQNVFFVRGRTQEVRGCGVLLYLLLHFHVELLFHLSTGTYIQFALTLLCFVYVVKLFCCASPTIQKSSQGLCFPSLPSHSSTEPVSYFSVWFTFVCPAALQH